MLTNKTNNERILKMFRKARRLIKSGNHSEAIQLIKDAEQEIRNAVIKFYVRRTPSILHFVFYKAYGRKVYSKLFCVLFDLKINIQKEMTREAVIKLDKIIDTDMYANYIVAKFTNSDNKMEFNRNAKLRLEDEWGTSPQIITIDLKGQV